MNWNFREVCGRCGVGVALFGAIVGCEKLPVPTIEKATAVSNRGAVVSEDGRGGYNWNTVAGEFVIERPPVFAFAERVDREKLAANILAVTQKEPIAPGPISGMDADVYTWFRDYTEPQVVGEPILTVPPAQGDSPRSYCLSPRGNLLVTIDSEVTIWDVENKKQVKQLPSPVAAPTWAHIDSSNSSLVFAKDETLHRLWFKDGRLESWKAPKGKIVAFAGARDVASYAIVDDQRNVLYLKSDFKSYSRLNNASSSNESVAISPDGSKVFLVGNDAFQTWDITPKGARVSEAPVQLSGMEFSRSEEFRPVVGKFEQRWINKNIVFGFRGDEPLLKIRYQDGVVRPHRFSLAVQAAFNASNGSDDWLCLLFAEKQSDGSTHYNLRDMSCVSSLYSTPFTLGMSQPKSVQLNAAATRVAVEDADSTVRVFARRPWVMSDDAIVVRRIAKLAVEGRIEQAELCASVLRNAFVSAGRRGGEDVYGEIVKSIGRAWRALEQSTTSDERKLQLQRLKKWYEQGSMLAELSYLFHLSEEYDFSFPRGMVFGIENRDANSLRKSQLKLMELAVKPDAPVVALELLIDACKSTGAEYSAVEDLVFKHIESRPLELGPIAQLCDWVSPKHGGMAGDLPASLNAITSLYPSEMQDDVYSMLVVKTLVVQQDGAMLTAQNVDLNRALRSAQRLVQQNRLRDFEVEALFNSSTDQNFQEWSTYWFKEHRAKWLLPSRSLQNSQYFYNFEFRAGNQSTAE